MVLTKEQLMLVYNALDDRQYLNDRYPERSLPDEDKKIEILKEIVKVEIENY